MPTNPTTEHQILLGDALVVLDDLPSNSADAVYVDPPFFTQRAHRGRSRQDGTVRTFEDRWGSGDEYVKWMSDLLAKVERVVKPTGSVMVHCDWRAAHLIRFALDGVFGVENFRNEIIWSYRRWTAAKGSLQRLHQTIFYYSASKEHQMNIPFVDYSPTTNLDQIWHARTRNKDGVAEYLKRDGATVSGGAKKGVLLGDVWEIPYLNPKARERTGYPTQKPLELLERLLSLAVVPGQVVLDPCCGSGTTSVAAQALGCHSIGIDVLPDAVDLARRRIDAPVRTISRVANEGRGGYVRSHSAESAALCELLAAHPIQRNKFLTGVISPSGLSRLGLPTDWSVAYTTEPAAQSDPAALNALAMKKQYRLVLAFGAQPEIGELDLGSVLHPASSPVVRYPTIPKTAEDLASLSEVLKSFVKGTVTSRDADGQM